MITVEEAAKIVSENVHDFGIEEVPLDQSLGRILREDIEADRDFPPYDRVTMDGIAIRHATFEKGQRSFEIAGVAAAGAPKMTLAAADQCLEVMTGAIMPEGVDTVIPYEEVDISEDIATITAANVNHQQNVHFKGLDRKEGDVVIRKGIRISSAEVGVCATVGKGMVRVSKLPRTIIISSGDELVEIDQQPAAHQIRRSNVYRLNTVLRYYQASVDTAHLPDEYDEIVSRLKTYVQEYDLIILSGGVSKGKFDYLPDALTEVGVEKLFHKIKQRPGKPFWFGTYQRNVTVFAFPGNPVSSFMCVQQYFKPWLDQCLQQRKGGIPYARLASPVNFKPDLTYFLEVKLSIDTDATLLATPVKGNGSGDLANLVDADAFIVLPRGRDAFEAGESFPYIPYRQLDFSA